MLASRFPKLLQSAAMFELALVQQAEAISKSLGFIKPMGANNDSLTNRPKMLDVFEHNLAADNVKASCWFIQQHHGRVVHESSCQIDALLLSSA